VAALADADPPLDLRSHETTGKLLEEASPLDIAAYKHREDLLDAALCAWTAALWHRHGFERCQVLGAAPGVVRPAATIIAPARPEQRIA
jgi:predicted RNase H-like nuclease